MAKQKARIFSKIRELSIPSVSDISVPPTELLSYTSLFYGMKGIGKTSGTASIPNSVNCMFEPRRRNIPLRGIQFKTHTASEIMDGANDAWEEFKSIGMKALEDNTVSCLILDTVDMLYSACQESRSAMRGVEGPGVRTDGSNGWDDLRMEFMGLITFLIENGLPLVFISHAKERDLEFMEGVDKVAIVGPSCTPACSKIMKQICDFWFYYGYKNQKHCLTVRDPDLGVDVACGYGFEDTNEIFIPSEKVFYSALNSAFKGSKNVTPKKKVIKKKAAKKTVKRKVVR